MHLSCSNTKLLLRGCSPRHHPYRWLVVNFVVLTWSLVLLVRIFATKGSYNDKEKTSVELQYLIYNLVTCAVWLVEVFFNALNFNNFFDDEGEGGEGLLQPAHEIESATEEKIALWIEVVLSAFFFIDSTMAAVHRSRNEIHRQAEGMMVWVFVNMAAYTFMVYRLLVDKQTKKQNAKQTELISALHSTTLV
ncbi:hypothetical protein ACHAW5_010137 [Stephanodiscus triporus]|uniref:Uncharacterized protein n=1 Tax=Stephanodiscus triporus TaxID=2934178 RepID=A0ABD3MX61_9STRA